jgi:hypothetical protein
MEEVMAKFRSEVDYFGKFIQPEQAQTLSEYFIKGFHEGDDESCREFYHNLKKMMNLPDVLNHILLNEDPKQGAQVSIMEGLYRNARNEKAKEILYEAVSQCHNE